MSEARELLGRKRKTGRVGGRGGGGGLKWRPTKVTGQCPMMSRQVVIGQHHRVDLKSNLPSSRLSICKVESKNMFKAGPVCRRHRFLHLSAFGHFASLHFYIK